MEAASAAETEARGPIAEKAWYRRHEWEAIRTPIRTIDFAAAVGQFWSHGTSGGTHYPVHQGHPANFAEELENVLPHEEEEAGQCSRDTDIPDEQV